MGSVARYTNGTTGGPVFVDVKDGKILRITPLEFDETDAASWTIQARGRSFTPPRKATVSPWTAAHRSTIYSPKRLLTPLKRVDFDPKGARNIQNRGTSGYEPISWDEALDTVAEEMIRIHRELGPAAVLSTPGSHHLWGNVGYRHSAYFRFMNLVGFTYGEHNPDSWEGWHWGAMHMWGNSFRLGINEQYGLLEDALKHTELIIYWSSDPESSCNGVYAGHEGNIRRRWLKELGVKMIVIDPYLNHTQALLGDKWFSPRLGTDVAMGLAIAFTWLTEGTYDKEYIAGRTTGFDEWRDYVLGKTDGVPKTPEWAEAESGIPAREIRALAREWAAKKTMLAAGGPGGMGGACRASWGNEWARTMVALAAMQGLGKPGSNIWGTTSGAPVDCSFMFPGYAEGGISGDTNNSAAGFRFVNRMFPNGGGHQQSPAHHRGPDHPASQHPRSHAPRERQVAGQGLLRLAHREPVPEVRVSGSGLSPRGHVLPLRGLVLRHHDRDQPLRHRLYARGRCPSSSARAIWFEGETKFADIILPACTNFERWDISEYANCSGYIADSYQFCNHRVIVFQQKCIEPLGESKSDYEIFAELAKRMDVYGPYSMGGKTDLDWVKDYYHATDMPTVMSWEEFAKKGYYVVPAPEEKRAKPGLRWFAEGRAKDTPDWGPAPWDQIKGEGLQTQSGKIEFVSSSLKRLEATGTVDPERPVMGPQYIESWEGHHTAELVRQVPAADGVSPSEVQLPHHGRRQGQLDERGQGQPGPQGRRQLLLDHAGEQQGTRPRAASPTATSSGRSTTGARSSWPRRSPSGYRRGRSIPTSPVATTRRSASRATLPTSQVA